MKVVCFRTLSPGRRRLPEAPPFETAKKAACYRGCEESSGERPSLIHPAAPQKIALADALVVLARANGVLHALNVKVSSMNALLVPIGEFSEARSVFIRYGPY